MAKTYYQTNASSGLTLQDGPGGFTPVNANNLSLSTGSAATQAGSIGVNTIGYPFAFITPVGEPAEGPWPTGDYIIQISVSAIGANVSLLGSSSGESFWTHCALFTSAGVYRAPGEISGSWNSSTGTGLKVWTLTGSTLGSSSAFDVATSTDRAACYVAAKNSNTMSAQSLTLNLNSTSGFFTGPWTASVAARPRQTLVRSQQAVARAANW